LKRALLLWVLCMVSVLAVRGELYRRELATRHLLDFCRYVYPNYQTPSHVEQIAEALEAVEAGTLRRLMICEPPRHGKSLLSTQLFPCWCLGRNPLVEIIQCGYSHTLTVEHSRQARDVFVSERMANLFPDVRHVPGRPGQQTIKTERQAAYEWGTKQGGRYYAVGVGGGLTGRGADIAIIDDPVKSREEPNSETVRRKIQDWYRSTFYTRLSPAGAIILIMTRWHPEDLAGHLLDEAASCEGDKWAVIKMPAINTAGAALWPERWSVGRLEKIRRAIGTFEWEALYQQEPTLPGGNMFCLDAVQYHTTLEGFPDCRYVRFWDLASTKKERAKDSPDYTVGALVGMTDEDGLPALWVKDLIAMQEEAPRRDARIIETAKADGPAVSVLVESVGGYKDTYSTMCRILRGVCMVHKISVSGDKVVRAAPLEPIFAASNTHVFAGQHCDLFKKQFLEFPSGAHDDVVDAVSGAYAWLRRQGGQEFIDRTILRV